MGQLSLSKKKKGVKGEVSNYITRARAIRKLQIPLSDFRKLCILKGIYPREPKNKKKVGKGSTAPRTYYYRKDIFYLMHEPILAKLRELKIFERKIKKASSKKEDAVVDSLLENKPGYSLDHLVKERYPSFIDALRDLDDALSMIFLFATLPMDEKIDSLQIKECQRLSLEFQHYVIKSQSLVKTFLSIKGIYYQAEIKGQIVTWIVPYQFSQDIPTNVDFRVMATFLEFYSTLLGFVNYKLYTDLNLVYPPTFATDRDQQGGGLDALVLAQKEGLEIQKENRPCLSKNQLKKRIQTLKDKMPLIQNSNKDAQDQDAMMDHDQDDQEQEQENERKLLESLPVPMDPISTSTEQEIIPSLQDWVASKQQILSFKNLFAKCKFYLNREVPRYSLEFVIRAFGGQVGWDDVAGSGSAFKMDDDSITHHIIDRPILSEECKGFTNREFIQPQWVYDCVNAQKLLKTQGYHLGDSLPPHLSPFTVAKEGDYDPMQDDSSDSEEQEEEQASVEESQETLYQKELQAEASGVSYSEYNSTSQSKEASKPKQVKQDGKKEARELAKIMMSKKEKRLYDQIQYGKNKNAEATNALKMKKKELKNKTKKN